MVVVNVAGLLLFFTGVISVLAVEVATLLGIPIQIAPRPLSWRVSAPCKRQLLKRSFCDEGNEWYRSLHRNQHFACVGSREHKVVDVVQLFHRVIREDVGETRDKGSLENGHCIFEL